MIYGRTHTRLINEMGGLMKIIPFLGVAYVIAGLASLGLPGLSGFVAEMNIFFGAFEHPDTFRRVATIVAVSSIVITAVYILRVIAILLLGPSREDQYDYFGDAKWYEKLSIVSLLTGIIYIGMAPLGLSNIIRDSVMPIVDKLL
jgi:NADH-quinone oxidoreductase subunit M